MSGYYPAADWNSLASKPATFPPAAHEHDYAASDHTHAGGGGEAFPVGSVFISVVSTNPATLLGYGTWSAFGAGRTLVGIDAGQTEFDTVEETGGAKTVASAGTVSQPTLTMDALAGGVRKGGTSNPASIIENGAVPTGTVSQPTFTGAAHNNLPPYITVYFFKRTA